MLAIDAGRVAGVRRRSREWPAVWMMETRLECQVRRGDRGVPCTLCARAKQVSRSRTPPRTRCESDDGLLGGSNGGMMNDQGERREMVVSFRAQTSK